MSYPPAQPTDCRGRPRGNGRSPHATGVIFTDEETAAAARRAEATGALEQRRAALARVLESLNHAHWGTRQVDVAAWRGEARAAYDANHHRIGREVEAGSAAVARAIGATDRAIAALAMDGA